MSLAGYCAGDSGELRIAEGAAEEVGIRAEGPVLSGQMSVELAKGIAERRLARTRGEVYGSVADYDPVLRWHCRL